MKISLLAAIMVAETLTLVGATLSLDTSHDAIASPFFLADIDSRAKCLDGSSGVIYVSPSPNNASDNWVIGSRWGGWCSLDVPLDLTPLGQAVEHTVDHCYSRSLYYKGSTVNVTSADVSLTSNLATGASYVSRDPVVNPVMWDWNFAWLLYCDGTSLSGRLEDPIVVDGPLGEKPIYFSGSYIREAAFALLRDRFGLGAGSGSDDGGNVVITGQSAGGLATVLHINWWGEKLGEAYNVMGVAEGGFFLDYGTCNSTTDTAADDGCFHEWFVESYRDQMRYLYHRGNLDINRDCVAHFTEDGNSGPEECMFAQNSWPFLRHPIFVLNSQYDAWQMKQMLGFESPEYADKINAYGGNLSTAIIETVTGQRQHGQYGDLRHGAFIDSCHHHLGQFQLQIEGVSRIEAVSDWISSHVTNEWEGIQQIFFDQREWPCDECCQPEFKETPGEGAAITMG